MARSKRKKFEELKTFGNVFEWNNADVKKDVKKLIKDYEGVVLELGCGKGEYTVELAKRYPKKLFIGVDIQGERIWKGAREAFEQNIPNAYFLRTQIENIEEYIPKRNVDEIWITFPDPFPKDRQEKKRLISQRFLDTYKKLLKKNGVVHLKTDSQLLYDYTKEVLKEKGYKILEDIADIHLEWLEISSDVNEIITTFEEKHLKKGESIRYIRFSF